MFLVRGLSSQFSSVLGVEEKLRATAQKYEDVGVEEESILETDMYFHPVRGKAITFANNFNEAKRDEEYFEHGLVFSYRPVRVNEVVALKITETTTNFHGSLRIGFTSCDPMTFKSSVVPLARDLEDSAEFWLKRVQLHPINVGTVICMKVDKNGSVLYGVDEKCGGEFLTGVDVSKELWMVAEVYGAVTAIATVETSMVLTYENDLDMHSQQQQTEVSNHRPNLPTYGPNLPASGQNLPASGQNLPGSGANLGASGANLAASGPNPVPLHERRHLQIPPLVYPNNPASPLFTTATTPCTPNFFSPAPQQDFHQELCIICLEKERNTAFTTCGHLCMCFGCAGTFMNQEKPGAPGEKNACPICRQRISSVLRVYA